ncbi:protein of unknown function [Kyrpidia spormannii]|uniref:Uncharacterized protein n=2 Tax=Kyrpidia spormannii TaxID=2055160 RepID=A0ACA8Z8G5_9BACL|nr:protein of unknown function [Kyrpidia spormannii]CAB3393078.1 protein of unknown function [Kyrpidia spormannii]
MWIFILEPWCGPICWNRRKPRSQGLECNELVMKRPAKYDILIGHTVYVNYVDFQEPIMRETAECRDFAFLWPALLLS